ncbi:MULTISPECIES: polysaccharide biosynthesis C-terminal domain-containing protein [Luteimonas]|uniref:oligosaccharide flippase family protein n=1 Tax=Luteimonas TaxID=83614 RepID=UPI0013150BD5|nr:MULTISPECIES: polysaccharide biosynthesis C-terminal domain-containing protein [Luteimonas]
MGLAFGFLVGVQLARGLGAEGYGVYGLAMSIIALLTVPTEFGFPQLVTREVAAAYANEQWGRLRGVLRWATRASMTIAAFVGLCLLAWLIWNGELQGALAKALLPGIALVPVVALLSIHSAALRGTQQIIRGQFAEAALRPGLHSLLLFGVPLGLFPMTPALAMWLGVIAATVSLMVAHRLLMRAMTPKVRANEPETSSRQWWFSAIPMAMTEGMRLLQSHLLILLLGAMVSVAEVGVFRVAASTTALVAMPLTLFNIVSMPLVAKLHATQQRVQLRRMLALVSGGMVLGVLLLSLPFFIAGEQLLAFVFGREFSSGNQALVILCVAALVNALFGINAVLLNMTGHQKKVTSASAFALALLLVVSPILIKDYGMMGAAYSNLASAALWNALMWRDCQRLLGLDTGVWGFLRKSAN